jgi:hypothetical protein
MLIELLYLHRDLTGPENSVFTIQIQFAWINDTHVADLFLEGPLKSHSTCGIRHAKSL